MAIESAADNVIPDTNRKVWVINHHTETHKEDFRGSEMVIPPNGEKKVLMPYLAARRFLAQVTPLGEKLPNGQWKTPPKALETVELTPAERMVIDGITPEELAKNANAVEEALKLQCQICQFQAKDSRGLKIHMTKEHGDREPITDPTVLAAPKEGYPDNRDIPELGGESS
jgi:hypothetical protein